jgi:hypothetical protein
VTSGTLWYQKMSADTLGAQRNSWEFLLHPNCTRIIFCSSCAFRAEKINFCLRVEGAYDVTDRAGHAKTYHPN